MKCTKSLLRSSHSTVDGCAAIKWLAKNATRWWFSAMKQRSECVASCSNKSAFLQNPSKSNTF